MACVEPKLVDAVGEPHHVRQRRLVDAQEHLVEHLGPIHGGRRQAAHEIEQPRRRDRPAAKEMRRRSCRGLAASSGNTVAGTRFVGRFSTTPIVPLSSCRSTSTTARAKLTSVSCGEATSSVPLPIVWASSGAAVRPQARPAAATQARTFAPEFRLCFGIAIVIGEMITVFCGAQVYRFA